MPVLDFDPAPKRFILPSTQGEGKTVEQQGWVEMTTYPLCSDDYSVYYAKMFNPIDGQTAPTLNAEILARRIKSWNYTDKSGAPLPINGEAVGHLPVTDVSFLINRIQDEGTEVLDETLKDDSSATSSTPPTATPQV